MRTHNRSGYEYGSITEDVRKWVESVPVGREFHYNEIVDELDIKPPTASSILLKMVREDITPIITYGKKAARYVRIAPAPRIVPGARADITEQTIDTGRPRARPDGPQADDLMTVIGPRKDGTLILRDESGNLWEASAL